jgi:hypothetical protein
MENSWVAAQLAASQVVLNSTELVNYYWWLNDYKQDGVVEYALHNVIYMLKLFLCSIN